MLYCQTLESPKAHKERKVWGASEEALFHEGFLSFLTTSAMSSMPFLEVANSLLGRTESRTLWRGRSESDASMSPMVPEERRCRRSSGFNSAAGGGEVTVSRPNKAKGRKMTWGREASFLYEVETETMMTARKRAERERSATSALCRKSCLIHKATQRAQETHLIDTLLNTSVQLQQRLLLIVTIVAKKGNLLELSRKSKRIIQ